MWTMLGVAGLIACIFGVVLSPLFPPWHVCWRALFRIRTPLLVLLSILAMSSVAVANRHKHHQRYHHYHHHHRAPLHLTIHASPAPSPVAAPSGWFSFFSSGGGSSVVASARSYIGYTGDAFGRSTLWCARFMNVVLNKNGYTGTGSDWAKSFEHYGRPAPPAAVGSIAVMNRSGGGHVGIVSGVTARGDPILISGNSGGVRGNRTVTEGVYSASRIIAYRWP